jgi:hypothetical protein
MTRKRGLEALMEFVAAQWCLGTELTGTGHSDFRRLLPKSGPVTADQFVDYVFRGSGEEARGPAPRWQRARSEIRAAFVEQMGGETADAAALIWTEEYLPLPDPEAFTRNLTKEELLGYREEYGERSREWILAQRELRRRSPSPRVWPILWVAAALLVIGYWLWRWFGA